MAERTCLAVVLAAGEGSRIRSGTPKVLHELCGRPMVLHVVDALGLVHALILRLQALVLPFQNLVFSGH